MYKNVTILTNILLVVLMIVSLIIPARTITTKIIRKYCGLNFIIGIISFILGLNRIPNLILFYLLIWIELIILFYFFYKILNSNAKGNIWVIILILLVFGIVFFKYESFSTIPSYSRFLESLIVFVMSIIYYHNELQNPKSSIIYMSPIFWFVTSFFIYYGGIMFLLLFVKYYTFDYNHSTHIWTIYNIMNIIEYIILIYGLICYKRTLKHSS